MAERVYKYDNIKALLIFLVVLGHMVRPFVIGNAGSSFVYFSIYLFHMPAFIYLMGMFTKPSIKRIKLFISLYIPFQIAYFFLLKYITIEDSYVSFSLIEPVWIIWYLLAVVVYSALVFVIPKALSKKIKYIVVISACVIALLIGYVSFVGMEFSLSRIIVFLPFFLAGYYKLFSEKTCLGLSVILSFVAVCLVFYYILNHSPNINTLHQRLPYIFTGSDWTDRAVMFITAFCIIKLLLSIIPDKRIPILSDIGRHTLFIFLYHGFIVKFILRFYTPIYPAMFGIVVSLIIVVALWGCDIGYQKFKQKILLRFKLCKESI